MKKKRISDQNMEKIVIGGCMQSRENFDAIAKIIRKPEVFYSHPHQVVWKGLTTMASEGLPFDAATLSDVIVRAKNMQEVRYDYLVDLWDSGTVNAPLHHAKTLVELYLRRELVDKLTLSIEDMLDPAESPLVAVESLKTKIASITSAAFQDHDDDDRGGTRWIPFPVEVLPSSLQSFVHCAAEALGCDPAFVAVPALVSVAAVVGNSRSMKIKESWKEPAVMWASVIADASQLKSPAMDWATGPLWSLQREMSKHYEHQMGNWKRDIEDYNSTRYRKRDTSPEPGEDIKPAKPTPQKILVNDITVEKLAQVLWENPHGVALMRDELSGWFGSFGRYADGKGPGTDMANWLSLFGARPWQVDRKGGDPPSLFIPRAACSVYGTIQPKIVKRILSEDFFDSGLASRLLFCMPPRQPKVWTDATIDQVIYDDYSKSIHEIYHCGQEWLEENSNAPKEITFTKAGMSAWIEFYSEWADRQNHSEGEFLSALAKLEGYCARICLLLTAYEKASNSYKREEVTEQTVKRAFGLVNWYAAEMERVYRMVREPEAESKRSKLIEFIAAHQGEMTPSRLCKANPSKYRFADDAERVLQALVEDGTGLWVQKETGPKGGRPGRTFQLKPDKTRT